MSCRCDLCGSGIEQPTLQGRRSRTSWTWSKSFRFGVQWVRWCFWCWARTSASFKAEPRDAVNF